ncbi:11296_t:CDS:1 [Gigaspora margarita]|uniref:11296_t:CDS:1 n=1 Tax=Gigaspora margarita TaxID=4874 RepID=A0ABN7V779_GIGMA|nr:11296_t:CDS:1 [Gigaspora margarita]
MESLRCQIERFALVCNPHYIHEQKQATSQMLTFDNFTDILEYLKDDRSSLHSCLLVSRDWFKMVVPLLWYRPFAHKLEKEKAALIIRTYVSCLEEQGRQRLMADGIKFHDLPKPFIDYPRYLRAFDFEHFCQAIDDSVSTLEISNPACGIITTLCREVIGYSLCNRSYGLRILKMDLLNVELYGPFIDIVTIPGIENVLSHLQRFEILYLFESEDETSKRLTKLFTLMSTCSRNINSISIIIHRMRTHLPTYFIESLAQLIQSQNKLSALSLNQFWDASSSDKIFSAMLKQVETLIYLRFTPKNEYNELIKVLKSCTKLETLELLDLSPTRDNDMRYFNLPRNILNIKKLYCYDDWVNSEDIVMTKALILNMCTENLRVLTLESAIPAIMELIGEYCNKITTLSISISSNYLQNLLELISQLPLIHLTIGKTSRNNTDKFNFTSEILQQFIISIPSTLISFGINFIMETESLSYLLREFPVQLKVFSLYETKMSCDDVLYIILQYAITRRSLKELRYEMRKSRYMTSFSENMLSVARRIIPIIKQVKHFGDPIYGKF